MFSFKYQFIAHSLPGDTYGEDAGRESEAIPVFSKPETVASYLLKHIAVQNVMRCTYTVSTVLLCHCQFSWSVGYKYVCSYWGVLGNSGWKPFFYLSIFPVMP